MSTEPSTILVVDDDPDVREAAVRVLAERGHEILAAANALEALREVERVGHINLLFTDIVMPGGIDGFMLARRVKEMRPDTKILYATAYGDLAQSELGVVYGKVVTKPYRPRALLDEVDALLGTAPPENAKYWREKAQQFREAARHQSGSGAAVLERRAEEFEKMAEKMDE
jgi:CheY-like chemotaxis protein